MTFSADSFPVSSLSLLLHCRRLIVAPDQERGVIYFNDAVSGNSFWNEQGVKPKDVIKSIDGTEVTMQTANQVFQKVFSWQPGTDVEVILDRNGEEVVIRTKLTQAYTNGKGLMPKADATPEQIALRNAWLKG